ncbi:MAG: hypothetical protein HUU20_05610 [Pirellulales bacterium]|nr:hypothetical protein [Pirellulales bacterium]
MRTSWLITSGILFACMWAAAQDYYGGAYVDNRASTVAEGYARGMADVAQAAGQYNLMTSQAAINMTQAQRNAIENRDQWTNTYFQMRQANKQYRTAERAPRANMETLIRYAQAGKPQQLSPSELDTVTGAVSWPTPLRSDTLQSHRETLDKLFAARARQGTLNFEQQNEVDAATKAILADLQSRISSLSPSDYTRSKKFMESLTFAARQPAA